MCILFVVFLSFLFVNFIVVFGVVSRAAGLLNTHMRTLHLLRGQRRTTRKCKRKEKNQQIFFEEENFEKNC